MRLAAGPTWAERHVEKLKWHRWFAWRPVRVGARDRRWLEYVDRKGTVWEATSIWGYTWEYRSRKSPDAARDGCGVSAANERTHEKT